MVVIVVADFFSFAEGLEDDFGVVAVPVGRGVGVVAVAPLAALVTVPPLLLLLLLVLPSALLLALIMFLRGVLGLNVFKGRQKEGGK